MRASGNDVWALITGASAGIGAEFAKQLAANGYNIILTARRADRLEKLARELEQQHGIQTKTITADLASPYACHDIAKAVEDEQLKLEVLINNAGYGVPGKLTSVDWQEHQDFLQVMVNAVVELSYRLLPNLRQRTQSAIINVASLAGLVPGSAGHTLYGASKAFLIRFSESLLLENEEHGVQVQALCPGFTYSEFHDVVGIRDQVSKMPDYMWMDADEVVSESLQHAAQLGSLAVVVPGKVNRLIARLMRWLPQKVAMSMVRKRSQDFRSVE